jgi:hypothetical protein
MVIPTFHGGNYHLIWIVALVALASALGTLVSSVALESSPSLCWHDSPYCAGVAALVMLALLPLLRWCCHCLWCGLPRCPWLGICQLDKAGDA